MKRSILIVCALGFAVLLGTLVSRAGDLPEDPFGGAEPAVKAKTAAQPKARRVPAIPVFRSGTEAVEAALSRPTPPIEFVETPFKDVIEYLKDQAHIEILLDENGCKEAGAVPDQPVTRNIRGIALADALDILLDELELVWTVHNDVLWITSPDRAESYKYLETRVYDVADLVVYQDDKGVKFDDYSPLTDTITSTVAAKSWEDNGGAGAIHGESLGMAKVLVVAQSYRVHKKIAALLARLREVAGEKHGDAVPRRKRAKEPPFQRSGKVADRIEKSDLPRPKITPEVGGGKAPPPKSGSAPTARTRQPASDDPFGP